MKRVIYEFKARMKDEPRIRAVLRKLRARFMGTDHQVDTYFRVPAGRLKVRKGRIENALIFYRRSDEAYARRSRVEMALLPRENSATAVLSAALGVLAVVDKQREIYFVGNVKVHLDQVRKLGQFVEVEAIAKLAAYGRPSKVRTQKLLGQARKFQELFGIEDRDIVSQSYSDLVLQGSGH